MHAFRKPAYYIKKKNGTTIEKPGFEKLNLISILFSYQQDGKASLEKL